MNYYFPSWLDVVVDPWFQNSPTCALHFMLCLCRFLNSAPKRRQGSELEALSLLIIDHSPSFMSLSDLFLFLHLPPSLSFLLPISFSVQCLM